MKKNIVCIGGGTGLFTLLSGLREVYPEAKLSAVVSMMDSGGSTGRLRDEFGYLPPGDIRQCLVALSDAPEELRKLMQHRFTSAGPLNGHNVGNLILTAFKDIAGGEYEAIEAMERTLSIKGKVYPVTLTNCHLVATLSDGSTITGETNIDVPKHDPTLRIEHLRLTPEAKIFAKTREAIEHADIIVIGPGDLYTSLMPNLVVDGTVTALKAAKEHGAKIIYVTNTMTKYGETDGYTTSTFLAKVQEVLDGATIDAAVVNNGMISEAQRKAYAAEHAQPVHDDLDDSRLLVVHANIVGKREFARHDAKLLAQSIGTAIVRLGA